MGNVTYTYIILYLLLPSVNILPNAEKTSYYYRSASLGKFIPAFFIVTAFVRGYNAGRSVKFDFSAV